MKSCLIAAWFLVSLTLLQPLDADIVYEFNGTLPTIGLHGSHPDIGAGESWSLHLGINTSASDDNSSPIIGGYKDAVATATVSFSGGFSRTFTFSNPSLDEREIAIHNDHVVVDPTYRDMVAANVRDGTVLGIIRVRAMTFGTSPLPPLTSDALPLPPTAFASTPDPAANIAPELVFFFSDESGNLSYETDVANNVGFAAIPEPSSLFIWCVVSLLGMLWYRRRYR